MVSRFCCTVAAQTAAAEVEGLLPCTEIAAADAESRFGGMVDAVIGRRFVLISEWKGIGVSQLRAALVFAGLPLFDGEGYRRVVIEGVELQGAHGFPL
jgi:hypothetical protein